MHSVAGINIFITGANRGLGLEMVRQCLDRFSPSHLFATYRDPNGAKELAEIAARHPCVHLIQLDLKDCSRFAVVAAEVETITAGTGINLLVNNAGQYFAAGQGFTEITKETLLSYLEVNLIGGVLLTQAFLPMLAAAAACGRASRVKAQAEANAQGHETLPLRGVEAALVVNISSTRFGSIATNVVGGHYATRCNRAAINALTKNMSIDLAPSGIMAIAMSPGWVQTSQGGSEAPLRPPESVRGMLQVIASLGQDDSGKFLQYDGQEIPW